jgi:hypothetical protein
VANAQLIAAQSLEQKREDFGREAKAPSFEFFAQTPAGETVEEGTYDMNKYPSVHLMAGLFAADKDGFAVATMLEQLPEGGALTYAADQPFFEDAPTACLFFAGDKNIAPAVAATLGKELTDGGALAIPPRVDDLNSVMSDVALKLYAHADALSLTRLSVPSEQSVHVGHIDKARELALDNQATFAEAGLLTERIAEYIAQPRALPGGTLNVIIDLTSGNTRAAICKRPVAAERLVLELTGDGRQPWVPAGLFAVL